MKVEPITFELAMRGFEGKPEPFHAEYVKAKSDFDKLEGRRTIDGTEARINDPLNLFLQFISATEDFGDVDKRYKMKSVWGLKAL